MTNSERIEAYFTNQLTEAEQQQLLQDINADAALKAEYQFQQEVIEGIKAYRKQELIARLDQVKIPSAGKPVWLKTLGITGVVAVATLGTYLWLDKTADAPPAEVVQDTLEQTVTPTQPAASEIADNITPVEDKVTGPVTTATEETTMRETPTPAKTESTDKAPEVVIPEITEPEAETATTTDVDISAPKAMSSSAVRLSTRTDVEVKLSKKYKFHYQVKDGGLILYGNFNDSPFEVLEMKTSKGIKSYLYYKEHFYALETGSEEIRPLIAIENQSLINELQKRR